MEDRLKLIIQLLNDTEVKGQKNLNNVLASIQLATGLLNELGQKEGNQE